MRDFTRLIVWRKAFALTVDLERAFEPRRRGIPGLRAQAIRAAASISANICDGCGKATDLELLRFLDIALASGKELYSHLLMAREVGTLAPELYGRLEEQREEIVKMLFGFRRAVQQRSAPTDGSG